MTNIKRLVLACALIVAIVLISNLSSLTNWGSNFFSAVFYSSTNTANDLKITPDSVTLGYGQSQQFSATATRSDGTVGPVDVTWTGHCGTITSSGLYTAGSNCGPATVPVYASTGGTTVSAQVIIQSSPVTTTQTADTSTTASHDTTAIITTSTSNQVTQVTNTTSPSLNASFTVSCNYLSCSFDGSSSTGSISSYSWDFGKYPDGTGSGKQVSTTYPHEGNRTVVLIVADSAGNTSSATKTFSVNAQTNTTTQTTTNNTTTNTVTNIISTKFKIGDLVQTLSSLNVRSLPSLSGTLLGTQNSGAQGSVINGPSNADGYNWWQVDYTSGADGWSAEDFLSLATQTTQVTNTQSPNPVPDSSNLPAHPRVWMNADRVSFLKQQAANNTSRWQKVKSTADNQLAKGTSYSGGDENILPDLCLSYLGTGNAKYAQRAGAILSQFAVSSNNLFYDSGYEYRFMLPLVTMGLDWCYDGLTTGQRQQAATWLMDRADWVWPESNSTRVGAWGTNDVTNNYYWGFMMTGPAALAAAGNDTGSGTLSGNDRAAFHRKLALDHWNNKALAFFQGEGQGGAWAEGTNYESTWRVASFADAYQTSGIDVSAPFLSQSLLWRIYSTMPGDKYKIPFGDQPRSSDASLFTYDRLPALYAIQSSKAPSTLIAQVYNWLNKIGQVPYSEFNQTAPLSDELLRFNPNAATADYSSLPKSYYASGPGFFTYRSSWTDPNATVMAFESGPTSDHGARDANGLMIWKGSFWVTATANIYSDSGIEGSTENYNNLTVGGVGQYLFNGNGGTIVSTPQVSDSLVAIRAQAKNGYGYQNEWVNTRTVSDYLRTVAYLPGQDAFVVVDRATVIDPSKQKVWRWQTKNPPAINGNQFTVSTPAGDNRCVGNVLLPGNAILGNQDYRLNNAGTVTSHAVTVTIPTGKSSDTVVTVLQCGSVSGTSLNVGTDNIAVTVGSQTVKVPNDESKPLTLQ